MRHAAVSLEASLAARARETTTNLGASSTIATSVASTSTSTSSVFNYFRQRRPLSTPSSSDDDSQLLDAQLEDINRMFASAREDLEDAKEDEGTTYFFESYNAAHASVSETLEKFESLVSSLGEEKASSVRRSMGLKMLQLKAELDELEPH